MQINQQLGNMFRNGLLKIKETVQHFFFFLFFISFFLFTFSLFHSEYIVCSFSSCLEDARFQIERVDLLYTSLQVMFCIKMLI